MSSLHPCYEAFFSAFDLVGRLRASGASTAPVHVIDQVLPFVEAHLSGQNGGPFPIQLSARKWIGNQIWGTLHRYVDRAEIIYSMDLNTCWRRFVVAKELSHLLFDEPSMFTTDPVALIASLLDDLATAKDITAPMASEKLAAVMAMEILLPHSERTRIEALAAAGDSNLKIATGYRAPERIVEGYLSLGYRSMAVAAWEASAHPAVAAVKAAD